MAEDSIINHEFFQDLTGFCKKLGNDVAELNKITEHPLVLRKTFSIDGDQNEDKENSMKICKNILGDIYTMKNRAREMTDEVSTHHTNLKLFFAQVKQELKEKRALLEEKENYMKQYGFIPMKVHEIKMEDNEETSVEVGKGEVPNDAGIKVDVCAGGLSSIQDNVCEKSVIPCIPSIQVLPPYDSPSDDSSFNLIRKNSPHWLPTTPKSWCEKRMTIQHNENSEMLEISPQIFVPKSKSGGGNFQPRSPIASNVITLESKIPNTSRILFPSKLNTSTYEQKIPLPIGVNGIQNKKETSDHKYDVTSRYPIGPYRPTTSKVSYDLMDSPELSTYGQALKNRLMKKD